MLLRRMRKQKKPRGAVLLSVAFTTDILEPITSFDDTVRIQPQESIRLQACFRTTDFLLTAQTDYWTTKAYKVASRVPRVVPNPCRKLGLAHGFGVPNHVAPKPNSLDLSFYYLTWGPGVAGSQPHRPECT
jgi:hypothetical protein